MLYNEIFNFKVHKANYISIGLYFSSVATIITPLHRTLVPTGDLDKDTPFNSYTNTPRQALLTYDT